MKIPGWVRSYLTGDRGRRIEDIIGAPLGKPLGCAHFGCVFEWIQPWVVKITRDPTEGQVWSFIKQFYDSGEWEGREGVVVVKRIVRLHPDVEWKGKLWPVHLIIREEVLPAFDRKHGHTLWQQQLYSISDESMRRIERNNYVATELHQTDNALKKFKNGAEAYHKAINKKRPRQYEIERAEDVCTEALNRFRGATSGHLGEFLGAMMLRKLVLRDVHSYNVGWRIHDEMEMHKGLVVFDPGHTPTDRGGKIEEVRLNPRRY